jgi:hypothetical protein
MLIILSKLIGESSCGLTARVLQQNPCALLVSVVKDSTLANLEEESLRFFIGFSLVEDTLIFAGFWRLEETKIWCNDGCLIEGGAANP